MIKSQIIPLNFAGKRLLPSQYDFEIQRSRRKTLAIHVKHRKVEVRSPLRVGEAEIQKFVENNKAWIEQRLFEESRRYKESLRIEKGRKILFRARELEIVFREGRKQRVLIDGGQFLIQGHKLTAAKAKVQVEDYLIDKASEYLLPRAMSLTKHLGVDSKLNEIKLRKTKSKWGHCTSAGVIQFNWLIMLAPFAIIDYIITHEVCHLIYMDHSKRYWELVD
jgi:predicted metal-dependent hydrolase